MFRATVTSPSLGQIHRSAKWAVASLLAVAAGGGGTARAAGPVGDVFYIAMENHNFTQPNGNVSQAAGVSAGSVYTGIQQIKNNPNAPFQNSLVNGTALVNIGGVTTNLSAQVSYANAYHGIGYVPGSASPTGLHPSEPNYIWSEAAYNFRVGSDNDPYQPGAGNAQLSTNHLTAYLTDVGTPWKSYQEDANIDTAAGQALPRSQWTVPVTSQSGYLALPGAVNAFNGHPQYNYAVKHNPMAFFYDTTGRNDDGSDNAVLETSLAQNNYAPLQQLQSDLSNNAVGRYNWITPNQFNDCHTVLQGGYSPSFAPQSVLTGDAAQIAQGDDFLKAEVATIVNSAAYKNNGVIVLWYDESESQDNSDLTSDDANHDIEEIVISPLAHANVNGLPYASNVTYSHSSDLRTWQEVFNVGAPGDTFLGDAADANDLSDLFQPGVIPQGVTRDVTNTLVPEPATAGLAAAGCAAGLLARRRRHAAASVGRES